MGKMNPGLKAYLDKKKKGKKKSEDMDKKKGGGIAIKGMGAAYKKGGMTKARAGKMMNMSMVAKKKKDKKKK